MAQTKETSVKNDSVQRSNANTASNVSISFPAVPALQQKQMLADAEQPSQLKSETKTYSGSTPVFPAASYTGSTTQFKSKDTQHLSQAANNIPAFKPVQKKENNTGLPDNLKSGVENLSGFSMDNVKVHYNSSQPAQLNALAYAQGNDIHVGPGQEKHLPHEAWHVVQQVQGRVQPTMQMKGNVNVNDDAGLEQEADVMGAKAAASNTDTGIAGGIQNFTTQRIAIMNNAPVQRLIGFEVEYQVPTFGASRQAVTLQGGKGGHVPSAKIKDFLFGGLPYGTELGGSAKKGENSFRVTSDHKGAVSTEPIRAKLAEMGKLNPANTTDPDASSNLEYVTSPVDELAKGADKTLGTLIDAVSNHATTTFGLARAESGAPLTAPAASGNTGTPIDNIKAWLTDEDYRLLEPTITEFRSNIIDSCYLQATVGILPNAIDKQFEKASKGELHHKDDDMGNLKAGNIYTTIDNATIAVRTGIKDHEYVKGLVAKKETAILQSIGGMIRLLAMYLVGEAISQTGAFPGGSIKNAVPFLVKIDPAKINEAGPFGMLFDAVPDSFVTLLAEQLTAQKEFTVDYWRNELHYEARARKEKDKVTAGSILNLTKLFLQGKKPGAGIQTGSQLKALDPMTEISSKAGYVEGIPLEYRFIKARPSAAGLKAELLKLVAEAREINLGKVPEDHKLKIENQVKE